MKKNLSGFIRTICLPGEMNVWRKEKYPHVLKLITPWWDENVVMQRCIFGLHGLMD